MITTANRDDERVSVMVEVGDVAILATASADADHVEALQALAELDEQLDHGLTVLGAAGAGEATDSDVRRAVTDGGADNEQ